MTRFKPTKAFGTLLVSLILLSSTLTAETPTRIVSLNGTVTEILFALGAGNQVLADDTSSYFPEKAKTLPKVGYQRTLTPEAILIHKPDLVLGLEYAGPAQTIQQLKDTGINVQILPEKLTTEGAEERIKTIGSLVGKTKEANALAKQFNSEMKQLKIVKTKVRVLFLYSRSVSSIFVAGKNTAADVMIQLSGAVNVAEKISDFKPLTPEALIDLNPDIILMPEISVEGLGGENGVWAINGMSHTNAGKNKRLTTMDDLMLLGFGPRLPQALKTLNTKWKGFE
ncbi:ABC transporter substrate-binding protein [Leptospira brenneri]|uniref:ABC transporter substrate-binding protein n=2 Tax=Leptospira brenneri TaxID=2023182 RepID=A0A2M9XWY1_9LEPT|nr:ABC transporter substrate-binding protein [Leptospira brenneri]TGK92428.1 ABC transporter substrate-binding protein [Leptospira brenneri]